MTHSPGVLQVEGKAMASIQSVRSLYSGGYRAYREQAAPPQREEDLARHLDERLTQHLDRLRQQLNTEGESAATEGKGRVVDILA